MRWDNKHDIYFVLFKQKRWNMMIRDEKYDKRDERRDIIKHDISFSFISPIKNQSLWIISTHLGMCLILLLLLVRVMKERDERMNEREIVDMKVLKTNDDISFFFKYWDLFDFIVDIYHSLISSLHFIFSGSFVPGSGSMLTMLRLLRLLRFDWLICWFEMRDKWWW